MVDHPGQHPQDAHVVTVPSANHFRSPPLSKHHCKVKKSDQRGGSCRLSSSPTGFSESIDSRQNVIQSSATSLHLRNGNRRSFALAGMHASQGDLGEHLKIMELILSSRRVFDGKRVVTRTGQTGTQNVLMVPCVEYSYRWYV